MRNYNNTCIILGWLLVWLSVISLGYSLTRWRVVWKLLPWLQRWCPRIFANFKWIQLYEVSCNSVWKPDFEFTFFIPGEQIVFFLNSQRIITLKFSLQSEQVRNTDFDEGTSNYHQNFLCKKNGKCTSYIMGELISRWYYVLFILQHL